MHATRLFSFYLLWQFVVCDSSRYPFSKYQNILSNDEAEGNVVKEFFDHLKTVYLEKREPKLITIVTGSFKNMEQFQPLVQSYPCAICTEPETCLGRFWLGTGNFFVIFLNDLREETVKQNLDILLSSRKSDVLFMSSGMIQKDDISLLFKLTSERLGGASQFVHVKSNVMDFYTGFVSNNCSMEARLLAVWTPGSALKIDTWFSRSYDLNGCPVSVTTLNIVPKMRTRKEKDGSLVIEDGSEAELIFAIAKRLNFSISVRYPSIKDQLKFSRRAAIINDVAAGKTDVGIAGLRPTADMGKSVHMSTFYDVDCVTWGLPRCITWKSDTLWLEFGWEEWLLVGIIFVIICGVTYVAHNIRSMKNGSQKREGFLAIVLDVFSIHLGNPVIIIPVSVTGKAILMVSVAYGIVITTAYKTSLGSIMATDIASPGNVDAEGMITANLTIGGASSNLDVLKDQIRDNKVTKKIIERFIVINNYSEVIRRLKTDEKFACLSSRSALVYERWKIVVANDPVTFNIVDNCVLKHQTVMLFRKELSGLRYAADDTIRRLAEFGITTHWGFGIFKLETTTSSEQSTDQKYFRIRNRKLFNGMFRTYLGCVALSLLTFFVELATSAYRTRN